MVVFFSVYFAIGIILAAFVYAYAIYMKTEQPESPIVKNDPIEYGCVVLFLWPFLALSYIFLKLIKKSKERNKND